MCIPEWRFVPNHNADIMGINDAGIETFSTSVLYSLVRESIQNSLDAQLQPATGPVHVEFSMFAIAPEDFPDVASFRSALQKCSDSNQDVPQAVEFFQQALKVMGSSIHVLRVSDHNTIGLRGAKEGKKGSDWSRLVKERGSSNKHEESGGSFGIGKSAAFACSQLRTVVYNSVDDEGIGSHIGVARLVSFEQEPNQWTTGTGYFSLDDQFLAILENVSYDSNYSRTDSGTDIYIFGVSFDDDTVKQIERAVLRNFFVSIHREKLIVSIGNEVINKGNLAAYIAQINPYDEDKELAAVVSYYKLISSPDPSIKKIVLDASRYGKKYGFADGDCTLYLMEGENLNRRVLMTRSAGMSLFEQDRFNSNIMFTGLLVIEGAKMNSVFKEMEVPSHDKWMPSRCKGKEKLYDRIYADLRAYMRRVLLDCFAVELGDEVDAFGAGEFLPDTSDKDADTPNKGSGLRERIRQMHEKKQKKKKVSRPVKLIQNGDAQEQVPPKQSREKQPSGEEKPKKERKPNFKAFSVQPRAICLDARTGKYTVRMIVPQKAKQAQLFFSIVGEQRDVDVAILSASVESPSQATLESYQENSVVINNLDAGEKLSLDLTLDFDAYCRLEVQYYASKK